MDDGDRAVLDDFEQWLIHAGYRKSTIRQSVQDVGQLFTWTREGREVPRRLKDSVKRLLLFYDKRDMVPQGSLADAIDAVLAPPKPKTPMERRRAKQKRKRRQQVSYADEDWRALWAAIRSDKDPASRVLEVMSSTGLRVGDVLRLPRTQLREGLRRDVITIEQKGGDDRLIYLDGDNESWARLHAAFENSGATTVAQLVAPEGNGSALSGDAAYKAVNRHLKKLGDALGLKGNHRTHRLRRTVAVQALRLTEDVTAVQQLMGHKSLQTTFGYVSEARPEREAQLRKQLGQAFRRPTRDDET